MSFDDVETADRDDGVCSRFRWKIFDAYIEI